MISQKLYKQERKSGIELLKIIAIFLIVISHVVQTLQIENVMISFNDYMIPLQNATTNIQYLILTCFKYFGVLGNTIFFVCSAWFLVGKEKTSREKALQLLLDVWVISVIYCGVVLILKDEELLITEVIKQFVPNTYANNWYMTCYIIFLFVYPYLNKLINNITQKQLLRISLFMSFFWIFMDHISGELFFPSAVILWVAIYFIIAYIKLYLPKFQNNNKLNLIILIIGLIGYFGEIIGTNILGLHVSFFADKLLRWDNTCNPFGILIAIGLFNLFRQLKFTNKKINYISGLSMIIYLVHENYLFRTYYRPEIWQWIYKTHGYSNIFIVTIIFAIILFIASMGISIIYRETLQRVIIKIVEKIYNFLKKIYLFIEKKILIIK